MGKGAHTQGGGLLGGTPETWVRPVSTSLWLNKHFPLISKGHTFCRKEAHPGDSCFCSLLGGLPSPAHTGCSLPRVPHSPEDHFRGLCGWGKPLAKGGLGMQSAVPWGQCLQFLLWVLSADCPVLSHPVNNTGQGREPHMQEKDT